jgi:hypothetical protein
MWKNRRIEIGRRHCCDFPTPTLWKNRPTEIDHCYGCAHFPA